MNVAKRFGFNFLQIRFNFARSKRVSGAAGSDEEPFVNSCAPDQQPILVLGSDRKFLYRCLKRSFLIGRVNDPSERRWRGCEAVDLPLNGFLLRGLLRQTKRLAQWAVISSA